jgi:hypothetical protein
MATAPPRQQWPPEPSHRRDVAAYICTELRANPYTSVAQNMVWTGPREIVVRNGLFGLGSLTIPAGLCGDLAESGLSPMVSSEHLVLLALHCLLHHSVGNGINWIRGAALAHPDSAFFQSLWAQVAFAHVWPPAVGLAASCARPDIMRWCRGAYYAWLRDCRRPGAIQAALTAAQAAKWHVVAPTAASAELVRLVHQLQIACVPTASVHNVAADLVINGTSAMCVAPRDKLLLAMHMLRGDKAAMFAESIPELAEVRAGEAFAPTALGDSWLDELSS